jgi:hypothetical protein
MPSGDPDPYELYKRFQAGEFSFEAQLLKRLGQIEERLAKLERPHAVWAEPKDQA